MIFSVNYTYRMTIHLSRSFAVKIVEDDTHHGCRHYGVRIPRKERLTRRIKHDGDDDDEDDGETIYLHQISQE